jgi:hypothetical protein
MRENHWDCEIGDSLHPDYFNPPSSKWAIAFREGFDPMFFIREGRGLPWTRANQSYAPKTQGTEP